MRLRRAPLRPLTPTATVLPMLEYEQDDPPPDWHLEFGGSEGSWLDLWLERQEEREREWREIVARFENDPGQLALAWPFLDNHPMFWCIDGDGTGLAPQDRLHERHLCADGGITRCVRAQVWQTRRRRRRGAATVVRLEAGKWPWPRNPTKQEPYEERYEDPRLAVAAPTLDAAFVALALRVHEVYGNDRRQCGDPIYENPTDQE